MKARATGCLWCGQKLEHPPAGHAGRPRVYCGTPCSDEHHNWRRRRERRLAAGLEVDQLDVFGVLPLADSHGRRPRLQRNAEASHV